MKWLNFNKEFKEVFSLNTLSILSKVFFGFILNKVLAVYVGSRGIGIVGNLQNFLSSIQTITSLGFYKGIVKYVAEDNSKKNELKKILSTSFILSGIVTIILTILLCSTATYWSITILNTPIYANLFIVLGLCFPLTMINYLCLAILNGKEKYRAYLFSTIITNFIGLLITLFLILKFNLTGFLYAVIITPSIGLLITFTLFRNYLKDLYLIKIKNCDQKVFQNLLQYSLMALTSAAIGPAISIAIRNHIVDTESLTEAGYWESINRVSKNYLIFISTLINLYFYPKLIKSNNFRKEISHFYKTILPLIIIGFICIYSLKKQLVLLLFTEEFIPVLKLFKWQLIGDFFKISSSIIAYQFFAKKMTKDYVITEIISFTILYVVTLNLVTQFGFEGGAIGYMICQIAYFLLLLFWFRGSIFKKNVKVI